MRKVVFVSQCLPYPPHSGVTNRTYNILRQLAKRYAITLVPFIRRNHQPDHAAVGAAMQAIGSLGVKVRGPYTIQSETTTAAKIGVHLRSMLMGKPYTYYDYFDRQIEADVQAAVGPGDGTVVHFDSLDLFRYVSLAGVAPVTVTHHSIESELLRIRARHVRGAFLRSYLHYQAEMVERTEKAICPQVALNVMTSNLDGVRLRALVGGGRIYTAPNGVDVSYFSCADRSEVVPGRITFLGPSYMFPNWDGVSHFLADIWPSVLEVHPHASFEIVGKIVPEHRVEFERHPHVSCAGYVPDVRPHLAAAQCCVVPLRIGGGTRLKILDAWAMGKAVVSTPIGCEGLEVRHGANILVAPSSADFARAVSDVLRYPDLQHELGSEARSTAERLYSWDSIGSGLVREYEQL